MAFCEQCGAKLAPGTRFCEECGAAVEVEEPRKDAAFVVGQLQDENVLCESPFKSGDWKSQWSKVASECGGNELGLIITREGVLLEQVLKEDDDGDEREYNAIINEYINAAKKRGVYYHYLNLDDFAAFNGNGDVDSVIAALREVVNVARPKYLMILGNEDVIDVARWENRAGDGDDEVESDLCYATLDSTTPWNGQEYDFAEIMRVGRIPSYFDEGLDSFASYFRNAQESIGTFEKVVPYGLSAKVWEDESNDEYKEISSSKVDVSPEVTYHNVDGRIPDDANLMFFNLHGNDNAKYWYGQGSDGYPEAFSPVVLEGRSKPYFLGVEACYGARYLGGLEPSQSILQMAMRNKCLAFLGSSKIAFGTPRPKGTCADIVIGDYIKFLAKGKSAGDAYLEGLKRLAADRDSMDDADVKTLAEFALYGDPSARMSSNKDAGGLKGFVKSFGVAKGLHIPMPNIRGAVEMALTEVDEKIEAVIDDFVINNLLRDLKRVGLNAAQQATYKMSNSGLNQKMYRYDNGALAQIAKVYFDDRGKIHKAIISK